MAFHKCENLRRNLPQWVTSTRTKSVCFAKTLRILPDDTHA